MRASINVVDVFFIYIKGVIDMKKDEMPKRTEEEPESVYGEMEETDPTKLNENYVYGGGGGMSDEQVEIVDKKEGEDESD